MVPMPGGLVVLTGLGAWQVSGGSAQQAITPANQNAQAQAYNGSSPTVPPINVNQDILYVQSKGSIVRDLAYNFFANIYTGTDMTVLSNHLFQNKTIKEWAYAEEPFKLIWCVRDDGILLSFTYLKEQEIYGWARHDTNGLYVSVCSVSEPPVDAVYAIVQRYVRGQWVYYMERMNNRLWDNVEQSWCVDSGLSLAMPEPDAIATASSSTGSANITSVLIIDGGSGYTSPTFILTDSAGMGATFSATLTGGVITGVTVVTQGEDYVHPILIVSDPTGSGAVLQAVVTNYVTVETDAAVFASGDVGSVLRMGGGIGTVVAYTSPTEVTINLTAPITATVPNDPDLMPVPAASGTWTLTAPVTTLTNLDHLEDKSVAILADGSVIANQVVVDGAITLGIPASSIVVGLPFVAQLQTLYADIPGEAGTIQGKRKTINAVTVRTEASRGVEVGSNQIDASTQQNQATVPWTDMKQIKDRRNIITAGTAIPLYTGDQYINVPSSWNVRGQVAVQQRFPLPLNLTALIPEVVVGDSNG